MALRSGARPGPLRAKAGAGLLGDLIDAGLTSLADLIIGEGAVLGLEAEAVRERTGTLVNSLTSVDVKQFKADKQVATALAQ